MVLANRFQGAFRPWLAAMICAVLILTMPCVAKAQTPARPEAFARGINISDYLAYPDGKDWPLFTGPDAEVSDADLRLLAGMGFTFVRLPVEPGPFLDAAPERLAQLEDRLLAFLRRARAHGLAVLIAGFARHELPPWSPADILEDAKGAAFARYADFLARLADIAGRADGGDIALELMNEPQPDCLREDGTDWTQFQRGLYDRLRETASDLTIVLTPGCWSGLRGLKHLDMTGYDANTLVDIHYYEPFSYTHQSATWTLPELKALAGLSFPARGTDTDKARAGISRLAVALHPDDRAAQRLAWSRASEKLDAYLRADADGAAVAADMKRIAEWADAQGVARGRIVIGEFGALAPHPESGLDDDGSRARWLKAVADAADAQGFGRAVWGYNGRFATFDRRAPRPEDRNNLEALGLAFPDDRGGVNPGLDPGREKAAGG